MIKRNQRKIIETALLTLRDTGHLTQADIKDITALIAERLDKE